MVSNSRKQAGKNSSDKVFGLVPVGPGEAALVVAYLGDQDYAANTPASGFSRTCGSSRRGSPRPTPSHSASSG